MHAKGQITLAHAWRLSESNRSLGHMEEPKFEESYKIQTGAG